MNTTMISVLSPEETDLADIGILFGVVTLVAVFALVWYFKIHHRKRRKRKQRRSHRSSNISLAQRGGLPPARESSTKPDSSAEP